MPAGFESRSVYSREAIVYSTVWPSASTEIGDSLLSLLDEDVKSEIEFETVTTVSGKKSPHLLRQVAKGSVKVDARYSGIEFLLAAALGFESASLPEELDTGVYRHLFEMDSTISARPWCANEGVIAGSGILAGQRKMRRGSYMIQKGPSRWTAKSCMVNDFSWSSNPGSVDATFGLLGYSMVVTSSTGTLDALSSFRDKVIHQDCVLRLMLQTEMPFDSGAVLDDIDDISFSFSNNLTELVGVTTNTYMLEPGREELPVLSGTFGISAYNSAHIALTDFLEAQDRLCMSLTYTGDALNDDYDSSITFWFPNVTLIAADLPVGGAEQITQGYSFVACDDPEDYSGFPVGLKHGPMMIEIITDNPNNPLL